MEQEMTIQQTYVDEPNNPKIISVERLIELTEDCGYYKKDSVIEALKQGRIRTPFAYFELIKQ